MILRRPEPRRTVLVVALAVAALLCLGVGRADGPVRKAPVLVAEHVAAAVATPAVPVRLDIPAIGVSTRLLELGLTSSGALQLPRPGPDYDRAGWYRGSPRPGAIGPAVIAGHVDSAKDGPAVFFRLRALLPGDVVIVTGDDGSRIRFAVDTVRRYAKDRFPTAVVYGDTAGPELRLITCGGAFDRRTGHYLDNTVVSAHLLGRNRTPYRVVVKASNELS